MKKLCQKKRIAEFVCVIFGVLLSIVGLYYFHMQYLCYEYAAFQFILAQRIAGWKNLDDVWMFGYWKYDWADAVGECML